MQTILNSTPPKSNPFVALCGIARGACLLGTVAGALLTGDAAHAAVNFQLEVENYYGSSITVDQVRYKHNNTWWETVLAAGDDQEFDSGDCTAYTSDDGWNREYCDESDNRGLYMHWSVANLFGECGDTLEWKVKIQVEGLTITVSNDTPANSTGPGSNCLDHFKVDEVGKIWLGGDVVNTELFDDGLVDIEATWGDLCLNAVGDQSSSTANVNMYKCDNVSEYWYLGTNGKIYAGWDTDLCLNIVGDRTISSGANANIYDCDDVTETWVYDENDHRLHAAWDSGLCLNAVGDRATNSGQNVNLFACHSVTETFSIEYLN